MRCQEVFLRAAAASRERVGAALQHIVALVEYETSRENEGPSLAREFKEIGPAPGRICRGCRSVSEIVNKRLQRGAERELDDTGAADSAQDWQELNLLYPGGASAHRAVGLFGGRENRRRTSEIHGQGSLDEYSPAYGPAVKQCEV
jgi:hypothetical protein